MKLTSLPPLSIPADVARFEYGMRSAKKALAAFRIKLDKRNQSAMELEAALRGHKGRKRARKRRA